MHFKGLDLNLLVVLDALLEEESVSRAALRLHVSQPAISAALAKLRWHTGDELLQKIGRTTKLTPRAQAMARPLKEILHQIDFTIRTQSAIDLESLSRDFLISMTSYAAEVLMPKVIDSIVTTCPKVSCTLEDIATDTVTKVRNGEVDLCVTFLQTRLLNPRETLEDLSYAPIFSDRWVMIAGIENSRISGSINFERYCQLPHIETRPGGVPSHVERVLDQLTDRPRVVLSVPTFELAIASVMQSECVTIVPELMIGKATRPFVKVIDPPFDLPTIEEFLVWHPRNDAEPGHRWFRELLLESAMQLTDGRRN